MSKRRKKNRHHKLPIPATTKRRIPLLPGIFLAVAILVALGFWWWNSNSGHNPPEAKPLTEAKVANPAAAESKLDLQKLKGGWRRPDGGYVLAIKSISENGAMEAAYFNPNPIHVAKAEASRDGAAAKIFIELRDVNYPGSTYTLTYDAASDQLKGIYYQAVERQRFEVVFVRIK
jgi:hypothetical protein